ncbi:MAG: glycosyltransferase family 39 protein [Anaerolineae bacterium]
MRSSRSGGTGMVRWLLGLILAAYVLLAVAYSLGTPRWEAPDEPSHYLYAEYLAEHRSLPPEAPPQPSANYWEGGYVTSLYEWYQPPLYYALVAPQIALVDLVGPGTIPQEFPPVDPAFPEQVDYLFAAVPDPAFAALGLRVARFFSIVLGLGTLLVVYRMAMLVSGGDRAVALTATGLMAFIPQYTYLTGYVTNDNLAVLLSAVCLLAFLRLLEPAEGRSLWRVAGTGLLLALALYTKLSLLFLMPLGMLCLLLRLAWHRSAKQWFLESFVFASAALLPLLLGVLLLPGMGDQVAYAYESLRVKAEFMSVAYLADLWPQTYTSFWGRFGWMNVGTPRWIAHAMNAIAAVGLIGSLLVLVCGTERARRLPTMQPSVAMLWAACGLVAVGFVRFNLSIRQPQGRLLFAALPAFAILVALGYRLLSGRRYALVGTSMVLFTFATNLVCLFGALLPAYAHTV